MRFPTFPLGRCLLLALAGTALAGFGPTQPQSVEGACKVKDFFIVSLGTSNTTMTVDSNAPSCRFTLFNPNLQLFQTSAFITRPPSHGQASAGLLEGGRMALVSYTPAPGYTGPDSFTATIEPRDKAVIVTVKVR